VRPLGPVSTSDDFTAAATLEGVHGGAYVRVDVFNEAARVEVAKGSPGRWTGEVRYLPPGSHGWPEQGVSGIRARSAAAGQPAVVTLEVRTAGEVGS
jgi:hypothetical protein